ncbi:hypothetical protein, partial [Xylella fastidiosa]|uniref:hypothetical protein n=1 Tax=Xylella fastidiosa TaxID=2371 RepID=UPI001F242A44
HFLIPPSRFMRHLNPAGRGAIKAAQPAWRWSSASTGTSALPNTTRRGHIVCQVTSTVMTLGGALCDFLQHCNLQDWQIRHTT